MFKAKFIISSIIFTSLLIITSVIKNKARVVEKNISSLNNQIIYQEKNLNETQLEFYYSTSPKEIERRLNLIGFKNYQPISYSKIFFKISDLTNIRKKLSNLNNLNEKKIQKK
tara:strand:- start:94 stop:432 length:339 start_codon:yes stop_codon:yes gene_type:complete